MTIARNGLGGLVASIADYLYRPIESQEIPCYRYTGIILWKAKPWQKKAGDPDVGAVGSASVPRWCRFQLP